MESWKSGSQMTRTIDLRHWAQRGDIVPRCGDRTFSALEGSVPMTVSIGVRKRCLWRRRHTSISGTYQMKLADPGTAGASVTGGQTQPFAMHLHAFPCPGRTASAAPTTTSVPPRSGHIHQGQDIPAACGEKLYAFEKGQVRVNSYQAGGAGYYIVIHGLLTGTDAVYMHMKAPSWAPVGTPVTAGQQSGRSARRAMRSAATCTSNAGACPVGTWAARRTTRCPSCSTGTAYPSRCSRTSRRSRRRRGS